MDENKLEKQKMWKQYGIEDGISAAHCWKRFREIRPYQNITFGYQKAYFDWFITAFLSELSLINGGK